MIAIHEFVFKMYTFKIFQNEITGTYLNLKKYNIPLDLAPVRSFFYTNTYLF